MVHMQPAEGLRQSSELAPMSFLLSAQGEIEPLPPGTRPADVLQGPFHSVSLQHHLKGWLLTWSSSSYYHNEVNHCASLAAGHLVKGDAYLVNRTGSSSDASALLGSPRASEQAAQPLAPAPQPLCAQHRIVAAQQTLARILGGPKSAGDAASAKRPPLPTPAPVPVDSKARWVAHGVPGARSAGASVARATRQGAAALQQRAAKTPIGEPAPSPAASAEGASPLPPPLLSLSADKPGDACGAEPLPGSRRSSCELQSPHKRLHTGGGGAGGAADAAHSAAPPVHASAAGAALPAWDDLPSCIVALIGQRVGDTVAPLMPMLASCRAWRAALLGDGMLLVRVRCVLDVRHPFKGDHKLPPAAVRAYLRERSRYPRVLDRASQAGNVTAMVVTAQLLDAAGEAEGAMRLWKRAAKGGHAQGQLHLGLALYRGNCGCAQDAEDAHLWLMRAVRQVQSGSEASAAATQPEQLGAGEGAARMPAAVRTNGADAAVGGVMPEAVRKALLCQAGLILGYMAHDGEGVKRDAQEAVKWFRLAAANGCKEAEQVLGWIFNTGQFG